MRIILLIAALLAVAPALADSEARQGNDWVRTTAHACTDEKVLANIAQRGENPLDYRAARAEFQGQMFNACWAPDYERRSIELRYDDGDRGYVPMHELKPVPEA